MREFKQTHISGLWLKAAAIGSIWAANEIILGSFLHNLRVPMSGTFMSFLSVAFVVAFSRMWPERGLIWRAGVIAALMKSLSPSAIIFGPMIGIMSEAFILEFVLLLLGRTLPGFLIGGALAVMMVLVQKVLTFLVTYGWDIIVMLEQMYRYSVKQFHWENLDADMAVAAIFGIYGIIGMTGGFLGYITGGKARQIEESGIYTKDEKQVSQSLFEHTSDDRYSSWLLLVHLVSLIGGFYIINNFPLWVTALFIGAYVAFTIYRYGNSFRHLRKPSFWLFFVAITLLAGLFMQPDTSSGLFSWQGLMIGIKMNIRAAFVLVSFASISKELKNPIIKSILYRRGFANLYQAIELAFAVLPASMAAFPKAKEIIRHPVQSIATLIAFAQKLLLVITEKNRQLPPVIIISGNIQEGKTTFVEKVINRLQRKNVKAAGFLSKVIYENGERSGYTLIDLQSKTSAELCSIKEDKSRERYGKFYFNAEGQELGIRILQNIPDDADYIVIDEIGPLELGGKGWAKAIEQLTRRESRPMIWVVREQLVEKIARKWTVGSVYHFVLNERPRAEEVEQLLLKLIDSKAE
jgi:nucleoside-triphosphatase THEP1/MFS family permease